MNKKDEKPESGELSDSELEHASGGISEGSVATETDAATRDPQSGLPTGQRMHKPIE